MFCGGINSVLLGHIFGDKNDDDRRIDSLSVKVRNADDMNVREPTDISMITSDQTIPNEYPFAVLSKTPNASTAFITCISLGSLKVMQRRRLKTYHEDNVQSTGLDEQCQDTVYLEGRFVG